MSQSVSQTDSHGPGRYQVGCVGRQPFEELSVGRNDQGALAERIVAVLSDRDRAHRMGIAGSARWRTDYRFSAFKGRLSEIQSVAGPL